MAAKAGAVPIREPGNPVPQGDNLTDAEKKEITYRSRRQDCLDIDEDIEKVNSALKALKKRRTEARGKFKRETGIFLEDFDHVRGIAKLERGERLKSMVDINWMAEMEGIPTGQQMSLIGAFEAKAATTQPAAEKDALEWELDGRHAYLAAKECKPVEDCPPEHHKSWMKGWHYQQERQAWSMAMDKVVDRDPDKTKAASTPPLSDEPQDDDVDETSDACETCGGDGSLLAVDMSKCPTCEAEYEPPESEAGVEQVDTKH